MLECVGRLRETYQRFSKVDEEEEALRKIRWWRLAVFLLNRSIRKSLIGFMPVLSGLCVARSALWLVDKLEFIWRLGGGLLWAYFNWVLSPTVLLFVITFWVVLFGFLFLQASLSGNLPGTEAWNLWDWFHHSLVTFVALQPGIMGDPKFGTVSSTKVGYTSFWNLTAMEMLLGYLHLPVFITLLIQKFTRR